MAIIENPLGKKSEVACGYKEENTSSRPDGRSLDQIRDVKITRNYTKYSAGSVLIEVGNTKVICTASIEEGVPHFMKGAGSGWITAEYSMPVSYTHLRFICSVYYMKY